MNRSMFVALALVCAFFAATFAASAAEPVPVTDNSKVTLTWDEFKKITGWPSEAAPGEVLVPWDEAQKMLGVTIKDVGTAKLRLPWKEFRALVEWSVAQKGDDKVPPPTDYVITKVSVTGTLKKDLATFDVAMSVSILKKKEWKRIRILPATVGIDKVEILPAVPPAAAAAAALGHLNVNGEMYEVLTQTDADLVVKFSFAARVSEEGGLNTVSFDRVASGTCVLDLGFDAAYVEAKDAKITVAGAQDLSPKGAARKLFALAAGNRATVSWEREIVEVAKVPAKLFAQTQTLVAVGDGLVTCREKVTYSVVHSGVRELTLAVPDGVNVLDVECPYLHDWGVENKALKIRLEREVKGVQEVELTYEKAAAETGSLDTPILTTSDTERERGFFAVVALANVEITGAPKDGASSVDVSSLPAELSGMTAQPILLGYRYVAKPFSVPLQIAKHEDVKVLVTIVDAATFVVMQTLDGRRIVSATYDVRNNRNQFLRVKMPGDAKNTEIWSVSVAGKAAKPAVDDKGLTLIPIVRSSGQQLAAFPVEIVYIDKSFTAPADGRGDLKIDLPKCDQPIMNVMCSLYLPKDGRYEVAAGTLKAVEDFKELRTRVVEAQQTREKQVQQQAANVQKVVDEQLARTVPTGVTPIRINLPVSGVVLKFQKILVLDEDLNLDLKFTRWPGYRAGWLW